MDVTSLLKDVGSEIKDQPRYGLLYIDIFSKKCYIEPLRSKDGEGAFKRLWNVLSFWDNRCVCILMMKVP